jgi:peptidoglycan hydrolase-like protein with peptidoglycan-binding domain
MVLALQQRLKELGYWLGTPDGSFGSLTQQAVWAFQKSAGLQRDGVVGPKTRRALAAGTRPKATIGGNGVEIDLDRQILLVVRGGSVRTILNTSTGSGEEYTSTSGHRAIAVTPRGSYTVYRAVDGPVTNSLGELWRPRFFHRGIAVHGSGNVPPWPASHGCARLSNAAINMIWATDLMPVGSRVVVR